MFEGLRLRKNKTMPKKRQRTNRKNADKQGTESKDRRYHRSKRACENGKHRVTFISNVIPAPNVKRKQSEKNKPSVPAFRISI